MKWISVKKKLPQTAGLYLVIADWMGVVEKAEFDGKSIWAFPHFFVPTHWMPLPPPPEKLDSETRKNRMNEEIEKILPPMLPFNFEDKIFHSCNDECEEGCECSKNPYSMNDWIKSLTDISGVNSELMGPYE